MDLMPFDLDEHYVRAAGQALGIGLRTSFRLVMTRRKGGTVETESDDWDLYPFADDSDSKRLARTLNGVVPETERAPAWREFPSGTVALGDNGEGDQLVADDFADFVAAGS